MTQRAIYTVKEELCGRAGYCQQGRLRSGRGGFWVQSVSRFWTEDVLAAHEGCPLRQRRLQQASQLWAQHRLEQFETHPPLHLARMA